jgi:hypothetical protein
MDSTTVAVVIHHRFQVTPRNPSILPFNSRHLLPVSRFASTLLNSVSASLQLRFLNMSFEDSPALESQPTNWRREDDPEYSDDPEFKRFAQELEDKLFSLNGNISRLQQNIALLGTPKETDRVRERIRGWIDDGSTTFKEIGEGLKRISTWPDLGVSLL